MRATRVLRQALDRHLRGAVHAARVGAVFEAVSALIRGGDVALSRLGRAIARRTGPKHGIKRIDRLYGNAKLRGDRKHFYRGIAHLILGKQTRPVILIDWTEAGPDSCALLAAVPCAGRAVVIYAEAHPLSKYTNPKVEAAFLRSLRAVLPEGAQPIIVTDAGFRAPWLRAVVRLGWDYIGRVRGRTRVRPVGREDWIRYTELYARAKTQQAVDLGAYQVTRYKPYEARLVVKRGRRRWKPIDRAKARRAKERARECAREPWLLATSLHKETADGVARLYGLRMQIEESIRDSKSHRFGWAMGAACTARPARVDIMVLLCALAALVVFATGKAAEAVGLHRAFQANTVRRRRVLSLTTLGRLVLLHPNLRWWPLRTSDYRRLHSAWLSAPS